MAVDPTIADLGVIAAVIAAGAAVGSWWAARQSHRAADALAGIEWRRWHADLTPQFEVTLSRTSGGDRADLRLTFVGPAGLDRLDEMTVTIHNDIPDRRPVGAGGPTAEQIAQQIWGPYRFVPDVDSADDTGRRVPSATLLLGDDRRLTLERTRPPPWSNGGHEWWDQQYHDRPLRLTVDCWREGHEPWTIPLKTVPATEAVD